MPIARIDYPNAADYRFAAGSAVAFNQSSYDADDLLNITWNFGDGNTTIAAIEYSNATSPAAGNTFHNYTAGGKWYTINLAAQEMARSQNANASRDIYIFKEGINVIPVISLPSSSGTYANGIVPFNTSQSYVLNCSSLACPSGKTCLAQSQTEGLYCFYLHAPNTRTISGYNLEANWTIGGQSPVYGNWSNYSRFVEFSKFYAQPGIFTAKVKLKYSSGSVIEEAESPPVGFSAGAGWTCTSNTTSALWTKTGQASVNATNNCTLYSSAYYPSCCPGNCLPCESNGRCNCTSGAIIITACNDYKTQASCNSAPSSIAKATLGTSAGAYCGGMWTNLTDNCDYSVSCGCVWNATASSCNIARATYNRISSSCGANQGVCQIISDLEYNCGTGLNNIVLKTTAAWTGTGSAVNCESDVNTLPCPAIATLSFFGLAGFLISALAIVAIYFLFSRKTK
jgi:hypothetical protein